MVHASFCLRLVSACVLAGAVAVSFLPATYSSGIGHSILASPPPSRPPASRQLAPDAVHTFLLRKEPPHERELDSSTSHAYEIDLKAGQYLHFHVEQHGVDVGIDIFPPGRPRWFRADSPNGSWEPEEVHVLADRSGRYRLVVVALKPSSHGRYLARIDALRPASLADRDRAAAQLAAADANALAPIPASFWQAAARYEKAIRLWQGLGDLQPQIWALRSLANLYLDGGQSGDALVVLQGSLAVCRAAHAVHDEAVALNDLGRVYVQQGDFESARTSYDSALEIWRSRGEQSAEVTTSINVGILYQDHGKSWQALNWFRRARDLAHAVRSSSGEINALNGMGWVYASVADWQRACDSHMQALAHANRVGDRQLKIRTLRQLGDSYLAAGNPEEALLFLRRALALHNDPAAAYDRALILDSMGLCLQQQGSYGQAMDAFRKALAVFEQQSSSEAADARINLGRTYVRLHRPEQALALYGQALQEARRGGDHTLEAVARFGLAMAERDRGNLILALAHGEAALQIVESLRVEALRPDLQRSYLAWHEPYSDLLVDTLMARHRQQPGGGFDRRAFERSEQARARQLLDALRARRELQAGRAVAGAPLDARWDQITAEISAQDQARKRPDATRAEAAAAERKLDDLLDQLNDLEAEARRGTHDLAGRAVAAAPALDPQLGRLLDPGTSLLEYYLQEPRSFLWVISSEGRMQSFELAGRGEIERRVRSLVGLLSGTDTRLWAEPEGRREAAERESLELSRILLGQAAPSLGNRRLAIAVNGALQYLPFAALPDPSGREGPLALWHEIVYIPSLAVLSELRERSAVRPRPAGRLAIVADPVFGPSDQRLRGTPVWRASQAPGELPRLAQTGPEGEAILALVPKQATLERTGFEATPELVTSRALNPYGILHFATHGTSEVGWPEMSAIVLSSFDRQGHPRDGYLRAKDVSRLKLSADLVVLSACSTALGPEIDREGMFGLPQSFLTAGARQVLVSLWNVGDVSTAELMQRFYRHLFSERPALAAGKALQLAQREMWLQPRWRTPDHWAGFVLQGDWR